MTCKDCKGTGKYQPLVGPPEPCLTCCDPPVYAGGAPYIYDIKTVPAFNSKKIFTKKQQMLAHMSKYLRDSFNVIGLDAAREEVVVKIQQLEEEIASDANREVITERRKEMLKDQTDLHDHNEQLVIDARYSKEVTSLHRQLKDIVKIVKPTSDAPHDKAKWFSEYTVKKPTLAYRIKGKVCSIRVKARKLEQELEEGRIGSTVNNLCVLATQLRRMASIHKLLNLISQDTGKLKS